MGAFEVELALERLEAQLAAELPAHLRAFAAAHAAGQPAPPAPPIARQSGSVKVARKMLAELRRAPRVEAGGDLDADVSRDAVSRDAASRDAVSRDAASRDAVSRDAASRDAASRDAVSRDAASRDAASREAASRDAAGRGVASAASRHADRLSARTHALLRLLIPIAIEDDPQVTAAHAATPTWDAWDRLAATRDVAARGRFGLPHVVLLHALNGRAAPTVPGFHFTEPRDGAPWPAPVTGWHDPLPPIGASFVERAWRDLASMHGARGTCRIQHADARPRAFVVEPGREVTVVIGSIASAAARFAALHELGHAIAALIVPVPLARIVDEAVAAYIARLIEHEGALDLAWYTPVATAARTRRRALAAALDAIERGGAERSIERPPWALWNDPAAQASYVVAETIADRWWIELGAAPAAGALAAAITEAQATIDRVGLPL